MARTEDFFFYNSSDFGYIQFDCSVCTKCRGTRLLSQYFSTDLEPSVAPATPRDSVASIRFDSQICCITRLQRAFDIVNQCVLPRAVKNHHPSRGPVSAGNLTSASKIRFIHFRFIRGLGQRPLHFVRAQGRSLPAPPPMFPAPWQPSAPSLMMGPPPMPALPPMNLALSQTSRHIYPASRFVSKKAFPY